MKNYDVFNGDADGICALIQLRHVYPRKSQLITGVKRDIGLLEQVPTSQATDVVVLDVSLERNRYALDRLLEAGSKIFYCDHHYPGESLPVHDNLTTLIDTHPTICTSLLIDQHLTGRFREWAITAAFGDNLNSEAESLAKTSGLTDKQVKFLHQLGNCINYNGYGKDLDDLHMHPAELFQAFYNYTNPLQLLADNDPTWQRLSIGFAEDMDNGLACAPIYQTDTVLIVKLPDQAWARRVSGVLGNELANRYPDCACAVITVTDPAHYLISIRAPLNNRTGADELARCFPTGGGRKAAAGINQLPYGLLDDFIQAMVNQWR